MGNFLDAPICEKETGVGEDTTKNISYGLSAMQVGAKNARRGSQAGCWQGLRAGRLHGCSHRASLFFLPQGWRAQMEDDHVQLLSLPDVRTQRPPESEPPASCR